MYTEIFWYLAAVQAVWAVLYGLFLLVFRKPGNRQCRIWLLLLPNIIFWTIQGFLLMNPIGY